MKNVNQQRLHTLDYLRGLSAFSILIFHFYLMNGITLGADNFIQRMGFYGVSIFYILSGLTLYCIYHQKDFSKSAVVLDFFKKRIYRIFPLFIVLTSFVYVISNRNDLMTYFLNITGLFSILDYSNYIITGGWSIGNELAFYLLFPLIFFFKKDYILYVVTFLSFVLYCYFSYYLIDVQKELSDNWTMYIHPFNQAFLFLVGMLLAKILMNKKVVNYFCFVSIVVGLCLIVFKNVTGGVSSLVYGNDRLIFTLACVLIVIGFFKLDMILPKFVHKVFYTLGEVSYGVYLIHPIVILMVKKFLPTLGLFTQFGIVITVTMLCSIVSFQYFEKFFMNLARKTK